ncbi:cobalamin synthase [compost metagenome]
MGVIACILLLLLKMSLIVSLMEYGLFELGVAILTAPIWSRWFMTYALKYWPTAREGEGLAERFHGQKMRDLVFSTAFALVLSALVLTILGWSGQQHVTWMRLAIYFILAPSVVWITGTMTASRISKKLGGLTGDIYGALNEGLEAVLLLLAVFLLR